MSPRSILFLAGRRADVSVRFRVEQYRPHLAARGIASEIVELDDVPARRFPPLRLLRRFDHLVVHRALLDRLSLLWLRVCARPWSFDFDDALHLSSPDGPTPRSTAPTPRLARVVRGAGTVIAGNGYLAGVARRWTTAVRIVPTTVDLAEHPPPLDPGAGDGVGWMGTRPNLPYLDRLVPVVERLRRRRPGLGLAVVCDEPRGSLPPGFEYKPWRFDEERADLARFAVGVMPLPDDEWTRGKCALKILQYFAAGRPVVCSPVGVNREVVEHGRSGFFAESDDEWTLHLERLLGDRALRVRMGAEGRRTVETRYSTAGNVERWLAALAPPERSPP